MGFQILENNLTPFHMWEHFQLLEKISRKKMPQWKLGEAPLKRCNIFLPYYFFLYTKKKFFFRIFFKVVQLDEIIWKSQGRFCQLGLYPIENWDAKFNLYSSIAIFLANQRVKMKISTSKKMILQQSMPLNEIISKSQGRFW